MGLFTTKPGVPEAPKRSSQRAPLPTANEGIKKDVSFEDAFKALAATKQPGDNAALSEKLMLTMLEYAVRMGVSDIHFDPHENKVLIRFRIDGQLADQISYDKDDFAIVPRLRVMADFPPIAPTAYSPEDGRFGMNVNGLPIQFRASSYPTTQGDKLVLRLLDPSLVPTNLDGLGMAPGPLTQLKSAILSPNGIFLVVGLTGCGKTTTLSCILRTVIKPSLNIMTLEDPVEYEIPRVIHAQINTKAGFTFAEGLRCLLRQDPNIIMVGEVRDLETAEIALRAAMTGHLIFSTLHTTTSTGAIHRLTSMGVEPYMIASALIGVLSQRLVRRVCAGCAEPIALDVARASALLRDLDAKVSQNIQRALEDPTAVFMKGKGCDLCKGTGYRGRVGLFELLMIDETMREMIFRKPHDMELRRAAIESGMETLLEDSVRKLCAGLTTLDEIVRAVKAA